MIFREAPLVQYPLSVFLLHKMYWYNVPVYIFDSIVQIRNLETKNLLFFLLINRIENNYLIFKDFLKKKQCKNFQIQSEKEFAIV